MLPLFDPALHLYDPVVVGLGWLAAVSVAGMAVVVLLVALAGRRPARPRAPVARMRPSLREAA